jgi:hypothetical protein
VLIAVGNEGVDGGAQEAYVGCEWEIASSLPAPDEVRNNQLAVI